MESDSGKILAMTQKDDSEANVDIGAATENGFQPGSIFKVIVEETGLENNSISLDDHFICKTGKDSLCKEEHGVVSPETALILSCNNAFAQIGEKAGYVNFIKNAKNQGIFSKVLNFYNEVSGDYVEPIANAGGSRLISMGQNMRITPVQAISIANTVANNGIYVKPYIISAYVDNENKVIEKTTEVSNQVIKKATADIMKSQMIDVVKKGTGTAAGIKNMEIGGKTGSTERSDGNVKRSDGWFAGFFKVKDKYYSMVIFVKNINPQTEIAGSTAAPIFGEVVKDISEYLQ